MNLDALQRMRIVITGGNGAIGSALARRLLAHGARVLITGRNMQRLQKTIAALHSPDLSGIVLDLVKSDDLKPLFDWIDQHWDGGLDALVHNAAAPVSGASAEEITHKEIAESLAVGPVAALDLIRESSRRMRKGARILLTSSGAGHNGFADMPAYCAAKFAVEGICQAVACDLWKQGISINSIALPSVQTPFSQKHFPPDVFEQFPGPDAVLDPFLYLLTNDFPRLSGRSFFLHEHMYADPLNRPPLRKFRAVLPQLLPSSRRELIEQGLRPGMAKVDLGEAPFPPSPRVAEAVADWMRSPYPQEYPDARCLDLRARLAARHGLTPDHILPGPGSSEILAWLLDQLVDPGCDVIAGSFCFRIWSWMLGVRAIRQIEYNNRQVTHDLAQVLTRLTPQTRLVYLDSPSNPMGDIIEEKSFRWFLERLPRHIWVVVDHAYQDFVEKTDGLDATSPEWLADPRLLCVRTLSKSHALAAWRVGYLAARPETIQAIVGSVLPFSLSAPAQIAACAALDDAPHTRRLLDHYRSERQRIRAALDALGIPYWLGETSFTAIYWPGVNAFYETAIAENIAIPQADNNTFFIAAIRDAETNDRVLDFIRRHYPPEHRAPPDQKPDQDG